MDISFVSDYFVQVIVVVCLCIGYVMKNFMPTDNKYIPLVLAIVGVVCGFINFGFTLEAFASGLVSGLASVGLNQAFKQMVQNGGYKANETTDAEVQDYLLAEEEDEADEEADEEEEIDDDELVHNV